ncbi:MAG TPA: hypothetical protein PKV97_09290 [Thauera aminoaromatica]|nr:hypothetical protein [Thauera aminoaromatica]
MDPLKPFPPTVEYIRDGEDMPQAFRIACEQPAWSQLLRWRRRGPNLYPHTPHHAGLPDPEPLDTIVTMAMRLPQVEMRIVLGCEDLETIAAELLLRLRPIPEIMRGSIGIIVEAYRHDIGLTPWRPGRRGIRGEGVRDIARLAAGDAALTEKRAAVYRWLMGLWMPPERWEPEVFQGFRHHEVTFVDGPLWAAWELSPIGVTATGEYGVHPGARAWYRIGRCRFKSGDSPARMVDEVLQRTKRL